MSRTAVVPSVAVSSETSTFRLLNRLYRKTCAKSALYPLTPCLVLPEKALPISRIRTGVGWHHARCAAAAQTGCAESAHHACTLRTRIPWRAPSPCLCHQPPHVSLTPPRSCAGNLVDGPCIDVPLPTGAGGDVHFVQVKSLGA